MNGSRGVLCAGSIVYDILVCPIDELRFGTTSFVDSVEYRVGGNAANTARALAILGTPVRLLGAVGNDACSSTVLDQLYASGVNTDEIKRVELPTATSVALINSRGERQFLHRLGASQTAFSECTSFDASVRADCAHFHLASFFVVPHLRKNAAAMLQSAKLNGLTTSFDTNWDPQNEWLEAIKPCLPHIDTFFMNEDESRMITGSTNPSVAARLLMEEGVLQVVIKLGSQGCAIYDGREEIRCPAYPVPVIDTTGAGDCFVAGFLTARRNGSALEHAGQFGNAVGALTVQKIGAVEGVVSEPLVREWMSTQAVTSLH